MLSCQNGEIGRPLLDVGRGYRVAPFYFGQSYRQRTRPTHSEYLDIRNISQRLYRDFTASKTTFFAIGRSPTPIAAYLAHMPDAHVENVPGSLGLRRDSIHVSHSREFSVLLSGLPQRTQQLVLIDYCLTGTTLAFFLRMARDYAQRENLRIEILGAALVHELSQAHALREADIESAIRIYELADFPVLRACLFREDYDRLAPFPSRPSMSTDSCRQIYKTYCRNLGECILYDSSNSAFRSLDSTSERALWMRN